MLGGCFWVYITRCSGAALEQLPPADKKLLDRNMRLTAANQDLWYCRENKASSCDVPATQGMTPVLHLRKAQARSLRTSRVHGFMSTALPQPLRMQARQ